MHTEFSVLRPICWYAAFVSTENSKGTQYLIIYKVGHIWGLPYFLGTQPSTTNKEREQCTYLQNDEYNMMLEPQYLDTSYTGETARIFCTLSVVDSQTYLLTSDEIIVQHTIYTYIYLNLPQCSYCFVLILVRMMWTPLMLQNRKNQTGNYISYKNASNQLSRILILSVPCCRSSHFYCL